MGNLCVNILYIKLIIVPTLYLTILIFMWIKVWTYRLQLELKLYVPAYMYKLMANAMHIYSLSYFFHEYKHWTLKATNIEMK